MIYLMSFDGSTMWSHSQLNLADGHILHVEALKFNRRPPKRDRYLNSGFLVFLVQYSMAMPSLVGNL